MADKKISQLSSATTPLTGTEELALVQGGSTVKATAQDVANLAGGGSYTLFTGLLYQEVTNAPTLSVLENTTGLTFTPIYASVGNYKLKTNVVNSILGDKTVIFIGQNGIVDLFLAGAVQNVDNDEVYISTRRWNAGTLAPEDERLWNTPIEIRIYP